MIFPHTGAEGLGELTDETLMAHLGYSGNHRMLVEQLADGGRLLQCGEHLMPAEVVLKPAEQSETPPLFLVRSRGGGNGALKKMQRWLRFTQKKRDKNLLPKRVFYNVWEAVYFNHRLTKLMHLAEKAAWLGAERFILDDGWFHGRTNDSRALGDWFADSKKYPRGLAPLINKVKSLGMDFGIWLEPEMVSKDSELYRQHPHWVIEDKNYSQVIGRQQWVINLTLNEAYRYIFHSIAKLVAQNDISYIKWDMNRSLSLAVNNEGQSIYRKQTLALYRLMKDIHKQFPKVEIESCSSGGGRIDYGILQYANRVWLSDSNDAHERARMQHQALRFLPPEIIGSHVGPRECHTSGRKISIAFRAWVAASCHMGYELDLDEITQEEAKVLQRITRFYKSERHFIANSHTFLLEPSSPHMASNRFAHLYINEAKSRFIVFLFQLDSEKWSLSSPLRLAGLSLTCHYAIHLMNKEDMAEAINHSLNAAICVQHLQLSGEHLTRQGVHLPLLFPHTAVILIGEKISNAGRK